MRQRSQTAAAAAAALGVAVLLLVVALPAERGSSRPRIVLEYEWKHNEKNPQYNALADFDEEFSQGPWKTYEPPTNVYSDLAGLDDANHKWKPFEGDENVFDETPEVYPFDETKGGHEWKTYRTESGAADIKEFNVMDTGSTLAGVDVGEPNLPNGEKFKDFEPERNVFESLVTEPVPEGQSDHQWNHKGVKDTNVFAGDYQFPQGR